MKMIVFDLDGTLVNTIYDIGNSMNIALTEFGYPTHDLEEYIKFIGLGVYVLAKKAVAPIELDEDKLEALVKRYNEIYHNNLTVLSKPYPDVIKTLKELKKMGYKLGVISNKPNPDTKEIVNHYFPNIFDYVVGSKEDVLRKPDKMAMDILLDEFNLNISDVIYVGDSRYDAIFSENCGCKYFLMSYGYDEKEVVKEYNPIAFLDNMKELILYL